MTKLPGSREVEFAILVSDLHQGTGLGTELLRQLLDFVRQEKLEQVVAEILPENEGLKRICRKLGFNMKFDRETGVVYAEIAL